MDLSSPSLPAPQSLLTKQLSVLACHPRHAVTAWLHGLLIALEATAGREPNLRSEPRKAHSMSPTSETGVGAAHLALKEKEICLRSQKWNA